MNKLQNSEPSAKIPSSPLNMSNVLINKILQEFSGQNGTNTGHSLSPPDDNLYRVLSELCGRKKSGISRHLHALLLLSDAPEGRYFRENQNKRGRGCP